ncbi:transposase, IS4-like family domain protein [Acinetobacter baumannii]|nr:transposase, IS4-like family domain protein [Acinetobacter baumannii]AVI36743.1 transposase, IS4-like family domain protein [Acinetobacter baumannii]
MVGRVKLYISALQLENGELLLVVSPQFNGKRPLNPIPIF